MKIIDQKTAFDMMQNQDVIVLDVRTSEEYLSGYIKNAINIPYDDIEDVSEEILLDKKIKILVYCRSGVRSSAACRVLDELGYENIFDFGGILTWTY